MNFGRALEKLKAGYAIAREGWNGKGMFVYLVTGGDYPVQMEVAKKIANSDGTVKYNPYMAIKNVNGTISTWVPSVNDCLAEDWYGIEVNDLGEHIPDYILRMKEELKELEIKIDKARIFLDKELKNPTFTNEFQRINLSRQIDYMNDYKGSLSYRIECEKYLLKEKNN